jgi:SAM-dependent methyltransferase
VSTFSAAWLALREPADAAARSVELERALAAALQSGNDLLECVDLACGSGANLRRLAPRLRGPQRWRLLDHDEALLAAARRRCGGLRAADDSVVEVVVRRCDLARETLTAACAGARLVSASALLDLVSVPWLERLADATAAARAIALFTLDYDGRRHCEPAEPGDAAAHAAFDRHQRRDKGFGPALGPRAAECAARAFEARGYRVQRARADWRLGPADGALQRELLSGWAAAAIKAEPAMRAAIDGWLARRLGHVASGRSTLAVGHEDLLAIPVA